MNKKEQPSILAIMLICVWWRYGIGSVQYRNHDCTNQVTDARRCCQIQAGGRLVFLWINDIDNAEWFQNFCWKKDIRPISLCCTLQLAIGKLNQMKFKVCLIWQHLLLNNFNWQQIQKLLAENLKSSGIASNGLWMRTVVPVKPVRTLCLVFSNTIYSSCPAFPASFPLLIWLASF
jgi:hypothetical protein